MLDNPKVQLDVNSKKYKIRILPQFYIKNMRSLGLKKYCGNTQVMGCRKPRFSTYSRSERHYRHLLVEPLHPLQLLETANSTSIFHTIAKKSAEYL